MAEQADKEACPFVNKIKCCLWAEQTDALGSDWEHRLARNVSTWGLPSFIKTYGYKYT